MAKVGRPPALDEVKKKRFCALVSLGCTLHRAAICIGCAPRTVRREANRNPEFEKDWRAAELSALARPLDTLHKATADNWRAASWFVERVYPQRFVKHSPRYLTLETQNDLMQEVMNEALDTSRTWRVTRSCEPIDGYMPTPKFRGNAQW